MLEMKTENCTTILEGIEGNMKEMFDGSAFNLLKVVNEEWWLE